MPSSSATTEPYVGSGQYTEAEKTWFGNKATDIGGDALRLLPKAAESAAKDIWDTTNFLLGHPFPSAPRYDSLFTMHTNIGELGAGVGSVFAVAGALGKAGKAVKALAGGAAGVEEMLGITKGMRFALSDFAVAHPMASSFARSATQFAAVDFFMSKDGPALSNMLSQLPPGMLHDIGSILASQEGDSELKNRLIGTFIEAPITKLIAHPLAEAFVAWRHRIPLSEQLVGREKEFAAGLARERAVMVEAPGAKGPVNLAEYLKRPGIPKYDTPPVVSRAFRDEQRVKAKGAAEMWQDLQSLANKADEFEQVPKPGIRGLLPAGESPEAPKLLQARTEGSAVEMGPSGQFREPVSAREKLGLPDVEMRGNNTVIPTDSMIGVERKIYGVESPGVGRPNVEEILAKRRAEREGAAKTVEEATTKYEQKIQNADIEPGKRFSGVVFSDKPGTPDVSKTGTRYGEFLVTKEGSGYSVTHIETGLRVTAPDAKVSLEDAKNLIKAWREEGLPEKFSDTKTAFTPEQQTRAQDLIAHWSRKGTLPELKPVQVGIGPKAFVEQAVARGATRSVMERFAARMEGTLADVPIFRAEGPGGAAVLGPRGEKAMVLGEHAVNDLTAMEEVYHLVDLTDAEKARVTSEMEKANGRGYKFTKPEEYMAGIGSEVALRKLGILEAAETGGFKGVTARAQLWFDNFWGAIKDTLGVDRTRRIAESFLMGRPNERGPASPFTTTRGNVLFSEEAANAGRTPGSVADIAERVKRDFLENPDLEPEVVPHRMTPEERMAQRTAKGDITTKYMDSDAGQYIMLRALQRAADDEGFVNSMVRSDEVTQLAYETRLKGLASQLGTTPEQLAHNLPGRIRNDVALMKALERALLERAKGVEGLTRDMLVNPSQETAIRMLYNFERSKNFAADVRQSPSEFGRGLRAGQEAPPTLSPDDMAVLHQKIMNSPELDEILKDPAAMNKFLDDRGGMDAAQAHARDLQASVQAQRSVDDQIRIAREIGETLDAPPLLGLMGILFRRHLTFSMLTAGRTTASNIAMGAVQPGRHWMGAFLNRLYASMKGDAEALAGANRELQQAQQNYGGFFNGSTWLKNFRGAKSAYLEGEGRILGRQDISSLNQGNRNFDFASLDRWRASREIRAPQATKWMWNANNPLFHAAASLLTEGQSGKGFNYADKVSYGSTRTLTASDEFIKGMVSDSAAPSLLETEYWKKYPNNPGGLEDWVQERMDVLFHDGQIATAKRLEADGQRIAMESGVVDPKQIKAQGRFHAEQIDKQYPELMDVVSKLEQRAHEASATLPFDDSAFGRLARGVSRYSTEHGWPAFFIPFVHSSYSLTKTAAQHMDFVRGPMEAMDLYRAFGNLENAPARLEALQRARSQFAKDILSGDPYRKAEATGRLAFGFGAMSTIFGLAHQEDDDGNPWITGALSNNKELRQIQQAAGWIDYGVMIPGTKTYLSIDNLEPVSTMLKFGADLASYTRMNPHDPNNINLVSAGIAAFSNNFSNKSYLSDLTTFLEAIKDRDSKKLYQWWKQTSVGAIPIVGISQLGQTASALEQMRDGSSPQRDARSWLDEVTRRDPFFGGHESLPLTRNVLGEPVEAKKYMGYGFFMPFTYNEVSDNAVTKELRRLQFPFRPASWTKDGVDLRDVTNSAGRFAYDRWGELTGQVTSGGRTLRSALTRAIQSPAYAHLKDDTDDVGDSQKAKYLMGIIGEFRESAYKQVQREFPTLPRHAASTPLGKQERTILQLAK
jgi:hypothetical protein